MTTNASCTHGASEKNRLNPLRLGGSPTLLSTPESVRFPSHSIIPSSTVTKYWYCGLVKTERKRSAKWHTSSSRHIIGCGIGHLRGFKRCVFFLIPHGVLFCYLLPKSANIEFLSMSAGLFAYIPVTSLLMQNHLTCSEFPW